MEERYLAEPFRIKMVEPVKMTTHEEREHLIAQAGYNLFRLRSEDVYIDLLSDSGTSAMSDRQWAALMMGDEAYAGSRSFYRLQKVVERTTGYPFVLPTHQGRAAENILFTMLVKPGQAVINNMHFDTTKAHVLHKQGKPVNMVCQQALDPTDPYHFKGDMDLEQLDAYLDTAHPGSVALVMLTITCNSGGGQPVSMANIRGVSTIAKKYDLPFFLDACRFAENAYFIQQREEGYRDKAIAEIVRETFSYADGCTMSAKKDALVNIGGFIALRDERLYQESAVWSVLFEGFPTYGGLAGRDLDAMAVGLEDVVEQAYLANRIGQVQALGDQLMAMGVPIIEPIGGHAVYLDAKRFLPHLPQNQFPAQALAVELYLEAGIRGVEIGTVLAGRNPETGDHDYPPLEMVRLTIPRRVYTSRHMDVVARGCAAVYARRDQIRGLEFTYEPPVLRHFMATFRPID